MFFSKNTLLSGSVVGTIYSQDSLEAALRLSPGEVDFLEIRVDELAAKAARLEKALAGLQAPLILTVRHPGEGGAGELGTARRRELFERFLPHAALVDVELRSAGALGGVIEAAQARGAGVILSHHDFHRTPPLEKLEELRAKAAELGATVFKLAAVARTPAEAARLLGFLAAPRASRKLKLAVMGMGRYGKVSRLALGASGSVLNYGYLAEPQVSGQWPAVLLKERLRELEG
ncbi:MAG: type I 3-dehydroquinate dehydratase [Chthoniobacteraceae bacterium]